MAAILEPRRHPAPTPRPALRLVTGDGGRTVTVPVDLGLRPLHALVAVVALLAVVLGTIAIGQGALAGLAPGPAAGPRAGATVDTTTVEAEVGDSLWTIARRLQPTGDVRPLVDELLELNGGGPLQPGQNVLVPS